MHNTTQSISRLIAQLLLHKLPDPATGPDIHLPQILPNPSLDILDFGKWILGHRLAGVESGEAYAETHILDIAVFDECGFVGGGGERRVDEEFEQGFAGDGPALLGVAVLEGLAVAESVGQRDDGGFAVVGAGQLLCVWEDDACINRCKDAAQDVSKEEFGRVNDIVSYFAWIWSVTLINRSAPRPFSSRAEKK